MFLQGGLISSTEFLPADRANILLNDVAVQCLMQNAIE